MNKLDAMVANAVLGIDTLWGGDVMCASGTGRFIADSWFSDEALPLAYTAAAAAKLREWGGVTGKSLDRKVVDEYLRDVDIPAAIAGMKHDAAEIGGHRGRYLASLSDCLTVMWGLAMEILGKGPAVPYERCVVASTARAPEPSQPEAKCERVAELLARAGYKSADRDGLLQAVGAWRRERTVPMGSVKAMGAAVIAQFDQLSVEHLLPFLPRELAAVPRANIEFLPIKDAWFSGSMNYVAGRGMRMGARSTRQPMKSMRRCRFRFRSFSSW